MEETPHLGTTDVDNNDWSDVWSDEGELSKACATWRLYQSWGLKVFGYIARPTADPLLTTTQDTNMHASTLLQINKIMRRTKSFSKKAWEPAMSTRNTTPRYNFSPHRHKEWRDSTCTDNFVYKRKEKKKYRKHLESVNITWKGEKAKWKTNIVRCIFVHSPKDDDFVWNVIFNGESQPLARLR